MSNYRHKAIYRKDNNKNQTNARNCAVKPIIKGVPVVFKRFAFPKSNEVDGATKHNIVVTF